MKLAYDKQLFTESQIEILRDYWNNPNQRLKDISKRHGTFESAVSRLITKMMKLSSSDRKRILSTNTN
ncbi:MAG: MarR family transcriptional regulator [Pedobacter sp.]|nr:MAG: MarR family transcriptional regulator [Pedobacter sp.]